MATIYKIYWDNGDSACGTFEQEYATEEAAQQDADDITAENIAQGVWDEDGGCEVIEIDVPDTEGAP